MKLFLEEQNNEPNPDDKKFYFLVALSGVHVSEYYITRDYPTVFVDWTLQQSVRGF